MLGPRDLPKTGMQRDCSGLTRQPVTEPCENCGKRVLVGWEGVDVTNQSYDADRGNGQPRRATGRAWYLLFIVPMLGTLIPPIYNTKDPTLIGIPFFYWYLMAWVPVTVVIMLVVNRFTGGDEG